MTAAVVVWAAVLDPRPDDADVCTPAERARAARFGDHLAGARWLAARRLLRCVLGDVVDTDPATLAFTEGRYGKPGLAGVEFNLSHAGGLAAVAVADRPVGVDLEVPRRILRPEGIARRLGVSWEDLPGPDRAAALLRRWTRTEAVLKATGDGAAGGLAQAEERMATEGWVVRDLDLGPNAVGAVAARGEDWVVDGPRWVGR